MHFPPPAGDKSQAAARGRAPRRAAGALGAGGHAELADAPLGA